MVSLHGSGSFELLSTLAQQCRDRLQGSEAALREGVTMQCAGGMAAHLHTACLQSASDMQLPHPWQSSFRSPGSSLCL